jgi:hypothetical protein
VLPTKFGSTVCFSEDELLELKGTHLFQATKLLASSEMPLTSNCTDDIEFEDAVIPAAIWSHFLDVVMSIRERMKWHRRSV